MPESFLLNHRKVESTLVTFARAVK